MLLTSKDREVLKQSTASVRPFGGFLTVDPANYEFAVFAAICSVVGNKKSPVRITRLTIYRRARGYKSGAASLNEYESRLDRFSLTEWGLRSTIERLSDRKFFARTVYGRRVAYYSTRMTNEELREAVLALHELRAFRRDLNRQRDEEMTAAIRKHRCGRLGNSPAV